jgi:hypothetical protein
LPGMSNIYVLYLLCVYSAVLSIETIHTTPCRANQ